MFNAGNIKPTGLFSAGCRLLPKTPPPQSVCSQRQVSVAAKPTRAEEFRSLSVDDIEKEIYACQRALLDMRIAQRTRKPFKRDQFRWNRHKIAQLKTVQREKELEEGIGKRESRKMDKRKKIAAGFAQY